MNYCSYKFGNAVAETALFPKGRKEAHAIIHSSGNIPYPQQRNALEKAVEELKSEFGNMTPVFKRYFFSDIRNQTESDGNEKECAASYIQQPPLDGSKVALWVVFQENPEFTEVKEGIWEDPRGHLIFENPRNPEGDSAGLTIKDLESVASELEARGGSLLDNCVRTWFMVHDIDSNYQGVVEGRNRVFARHGLTRDTHYISSTGIGGTPDIPGQTVSFNAICDTQLKPGQMGFVYGKSHLNPTYEYGVAFERGTFVDYADRRHVYISGTASIDNKGAILHIGDIRRQTERMIENIMVLLSEAGCGVNDIAHLLVYLRDIADYQCVSEVFERELPGVPRLLVLAPVCRPGWLVETECIAIKDTVNSEFQDF